MKQIEGYNKFLYLLRANLTQASYTIEVWGMIWNGVLVVGNNLSISPEDQLAAFATFYHERKTHYETN